VGDDILASGTAIRDVLDVKFPHWSYHSTVELVGVAAAGGEHLPHLAEVLGQISPIMAGHFAREDLQAVRQVG